jgi:hypothetical protein
MCGKSPATVRKRGDPQRVQSLRRLGSKLRRVARSVRVNARSPALFVAIDDHQIGLSAWMKSLKGTLSSELRAKGCASPYWQKGFFDHILRSKESYSGKWQYVRENPVRAGLVKSWEEWPYLGEVFDLQFHDARFWREVRRSETAATAQSSHAYACLTRRLHSA